MSIPPIPPLPIPPLPLSLVKKLSDTTPEGFFTAFLLAKTLSTRNH
ncbi:MAG: hypothetical protein AAFR25_02775 [Cyanobacteria bacterium J06629_19]